MYTKNDVGCFIDNSAGIYSDAEIIGRLVTLLRNNDDAKASRWCIGWIKEIVAVLATSPTAKDDILESLQSDIDKLTDMLNEYCDQYTAFEWIDNSLCLVRLTEDYRED